MIPLQRSARRVTGTATLFFALVACPCHLAITWPLLAGAIGLGTLALHPGLLAVATAAFVALVALGWWLLSTPNLAHSHAASLTPTDEGGADRSSCLLTTPEPRARSLGSSSQEVHP